MATAAATLDRSLLPARSAPVALQRFAWAVVGYNILVILWGALVRATGSGAGCGNHWPLCNGQVVPLAPRLDTIIEFTHRMMVGGATFAVFALLLWTWLATPKGAAARIAAAVATILLVNEAFLGALLVKLGYVTGNQSIGRVIVLSIHLGNTLLLLAALTVTAHLLSTSASTRIVRSVRNGWLLLAGLSATLLVCITGSLAALGDTLFPASSLSAAFAQDFATGSPWLLRVRWVHPASAAVAAAFVVWLIVQAWQVHPRLARWLTILLGSQLVLGTADMLLLAPVFMQIVHLLGADIFWVTLVLLSATWAIQERVQKPVVEAYRPDRLPDTEKPSAEVDPHRAPQSSFSG